MQRVSITAAENSTAGQTTPNSNNSTDFRKVAAQIPVNKSKV